MLSELSTRLRRITNGRPWVPEIDGLRFLAIAGVVLFHMLGETLSRSGQQLYLESRYDLVNFAIGNGDRGVRLFFVISGLVLALPFARQFLTSGKPVSLQKYYMRRLTRLEPPYIASILLFVMLLVLYTHEIQSHLAQHVLATVFYMHNLTYGDISPINMVSWSLEIEVQFYLIAPFIMQVFRIPGKHMRRLVLLALIALSMPVQASVANSPRLHLSILRYVSYFLSGLLAADFFVIDLPLWLERPMWDVLALACMICAVTLPHDSELAHAALSLIFAALCLAAMRGPITRRFVATPWVAVVGGMCYSIYLVHMTAIAIVFKVSRRLIFAHGNTIGVDTLLIQALVFVPAVLLAGTAFYILIERPCMDPQWPAKLRQWILNRNKKPVMAIRS